MQRNRKTVPDKTEEGKMEEWKSLWGLAGKAGIGKYGNDFVGNRTLQHPLEMNV